jgi:hypothetical protein
VGGKYTWMKYLLNNLSAGILQMLVSCPAEVIASYVDDILYTVEWLIGIQDEAGNWPSSFKLKKDLGNELVQ